MGILLRLVSVKTRLYSKLEKLPQSSYNTPAVGQRGVPVDMLNSQDTRNSEGFQPILKHLFRNEEFGAKLSPQDWHVGSVLLSEGLPQLSFRHEERRCISISLPFNQVAVS